MAGIALLSACSGGEPEEAAPGDNATASTGTSVTPTSLADPSVSPTSLPDNSSIDPAYPAIPMRDESGLDPGAIGEGWFLVEYDRSSGDTSPVNFLIDPDGAMYRTTTYVFPEDTFFSLWLGDVYWFSRPTSECYECSPIGDVLRGVFSTGSVETVSSGYLVGPLEVVADGGVRVTYGESRTDFSQFRSRVVSLDGTSIEGDHFFNPSTTSPDGTRRVVFKRLDGPPLEVYVETNDGVSTKIADFTRYANAYTWVGWKDEDELYFSSSEPTSGDTPFGPRMDFILDVDTGNVTQTSFTTDPNEFVYSFLTSPGLFAAYSFERREAHSPVLHRLVRQDGTTIFSRWCASFCTFEFSGDRALLVEMTVRSGPNSVTTVDRLTIIDLDTGAIVDEIDTEDTGRFEVIPFGANHW